MPAAAHVITLGLEDSLNVSIRAWFLQFNHMPPIPLVAAQIDTVPAGKASFTHLLQMMAESRHRNFILIIHGLPDGSGLWLRLTPHFHNRQTTFHDLRRLMELDARGPELDRRDSAVLSGSKHVGKAMLERIQKESHDILALMHAVHSKKIDCIEFRACNLGRNPSSLNRFRRFFGARRLGAPNIHSFFGMVPVTTNPEMLRTHETGHKGHVWETYAFPSAYKTPKLVCCFALNHLQKPEYGGHVAADSAATLNDWVKHYVMRTGHGSAHTIAMHGLWIADIAVAPTKPGEKTRYVPAAIDIDAEQTDSPLGGWGGPSIRRFIPPLADSYGKHIVYST